jgi:hypothetical protein
VQLTNRISKIDASLNPNFLKITRSETNDIKFKKTWAFNRLTKNGPNSLKNKAGTNQNPIPKGIPKSL